MTAARWRKGGGGSSGHDSPELFAAALCYALSRTAIAHGAGWQALRGRHDARSMSDDGCSVIFGSPLHCLIPYRFRWRLRNEGLVSEVVSKPALAAIPFALVAGGGKRRGDAIRREQACVAIADAGAPADSGDWIEAVTLPDDSRGLLPKFVKLPAEIEGVICE